MTTPEAMVNYPPSVLNSTPTYGFAASVPFVRYIASEDELYIIGRSCQRLTDGDYYRSIFEMVIQHLQKHPRLTIYLCLKTLSSSAVKALYDFLKGCRRLLLENYELRLIWLTDRRNPELKTTGQEFEDLFQINMKVADI